MKRKMIILLAVLLLAGCETPREHPSGHSHGQLFSKTWEDRHKCPYCGGTFTIRGREVRPRGPVKITVIEWCECGRIRDAD